MPLNAGFSPYFKYALFLLFLLLLFAWFCHPNLPDMSEKATVESTLYRYETAVRHRLSDDLTRAGFQDFPDRIMLLAFKEERQLELYGFNTGWIKIKTYPFTAFSGELGPKLREGDKQIPEGIYRIEHLNPNSKYHLSLKLNYPNDFDREKARLENREHPGSDIFIHGKAVTVGCIPVGDEAIEELFVLCSQAYKAGISVVISPRDFRRNKIYPPVPGIEWEEELYTALHQALEKI